MKERENMSEKFDEWEDIQSPCSPPKAKWNNSKIPTKLEIRDEFFVSGSSVFPPSDHEKLPITASPQNSQVLQEQEVGSISEDNDSSPPEKNEAEVRNNEDGAWIRKKIESLSSGIAWFASKMRTFGENKVGLWSLASATSGVAAVILLTLLYMRLKKPKRPVKSESKEHHLVLLIKEKDQRISELLLQISQLKEMLVANRKVPVLRVH